MCTHIMHVCTSTFTHVYTNTVMITPTSNNCMYIYIPVLYICTYLAILHHYPTYVQKHVFSNIIVLERLIRYNNIHTHTGLLDQMHEGKHTHHYYHALMSWFVLCRHPLLGGSIVFEVDVYIHM